MSQTLQPLAAPGLVLHDTVAHVIARALIRHGVTHVFGQSLPSMLHLACEALGLTQIAYRSENAGGYMADGYARITGKPAVVTAQNGPAATLLVAPLAEALKVSIPVIALVQDVNRDQTDKNAFQEFDHQALFASCTKWVRRVTEASRVEDYIDQAFAIACSGRPGPVALMLPADLLNEAAVRCGERQASLGVFPLDRSVAAPQAIEAAAELLASASRPLVIAGGGVHISGASEALAGLQEAAHLPVATTVMGKGSVDENHPLSLGVVGYFMGPGSATRELRPLVSEADVILLVGTRTNQNATDSWKLYPSSARYIHIDVDGAEIGRNYEALRLAGDARETLLALTQAMAARDLSGASRRRAEVQERIAKGRRESWAGSASWRESSAAPIRPERLMAATPRSGSPTICGRAVSASVSLPRAGWPAWVGASRWPWAPRWPGRRRMSCASWATVASGMSGPSWRRPGAWRSRSPWWSSITAFWASRSMPRTSSSARIRRPCIFTTSIMPPSPRPAAARACA